LARVPEGDEEVERISKRRHTDDERVEDSQAEADKIAADLQATELSPIQLWDDLDAGDWDDPLMVSEYVTEVCDYLKEIEVRWFPFVHLVEFPTISY
jgi:G2/mitotic-specific cyclin 1/2